MNSVKIIIGHVVECYIRLYFNIRCKYLKNAMRMYELYVPIYKRVLTSVFVKVNM